MVKARINVVQRGFFALAVRARLTPPPAETISIEHEDLTTAWLADARLAETNGHIGGTLPRTLPAFALDHLRL